MSHHRPTPSLPGTLPPALPPVLADIIAHVRTVVDASKAALPVAALREAVAAAPPCRGFVRSLHAAAPFAIIAEVKRQSPSAGLIRPSYAGPGFSPGAIAQQYAAHGAAAISCLTEERFFGGAPDYLRLVRQSVPQPVLRKDFIFDSHQLLHARALGADAALLMAECLPDDSLQELAGIALALGLDVLIEAHDAHNIPRAWDVVRQCGDRALLGINNRDLSTMHVDLEHTARMVREYRIPPELVVAESGIRSHADLQTIAQSGVRKALVGEHLMRQASPGEALARLLTPTLDGNDR
jgi:indole-3-glycerol phosphate synthase